MKNTSLTLFLLVCTLGLYSQNPVASTKDRNIIGLGGEANPYAQISTFDDRYEGVEGTPYWDDYFYQGSVWMNNGGTKEDIPIVLNIHERQIETILNSMLHVIPFSLVDSLVMQDSTGQQHIFLMRQINTDKGQREAALVQCLYQGKSTFYKVYEKVFREADYQGPYSSDQRKDVYRDEIKYFFRLGDDTSFQRVRLNRSSCLKALESQKAALKTYIKQEKLGLEEEQELVQLLGYFDRLNQ
ncbi:MAG: hypothetical protein AAFQ87_18915 [Bacteroidota bacterium]